MKTIKHILFLGSVFALILIISCAKEKTALLDESNLSLQVIKKINEYDPPKNIASDKFSRFTRTKNAGTLKNSNEDIRLDEGMWLTEAYVNFEKGFRNDSIESVSIDTTRYTLEIKDWVDQIPIVEGNHIDALIDTIILRIEIDRNSEYLFWATYLEVENISEEFVNLYVVNAGGPKSNTRKTVLSPEKPGEYLQPFPVGYSTKAGYLPYAMLWAERDFWEKTAGEEGYIDGRFTLVLVSNFLKCAYISPGVADPRLFWAYGGCESYVMNSQQPNQYLISSKQLIDDNNPIVSTEDLVIGYYHWYCFNTGNSTGPSPDSQWTSNHWFQHCIDFFIYRKVYYMPEE